MGSAVDQMSNLTINSNSDSMSLSVLKLCDDGSNWAHYQPRIERALGSKGLWRYVKGTAIAPKLYAFPVLVDGKIPAMEEQIESKESRIADFEKCEYMAQHIILSYTLTCLGSKIKDLKTVKEMWTTADTTTKSTLYLIDVEDQLLSMKLAYNDDAKVHLTELKQYF